MKTTEDILKAKYLKTPPEPEVDPEYEEHLECQRRLDELITKQRRLKEQELSKLPDSIRKILETVK